MPKDRRYTRKELETLRRADLQGLYKINGLRGANQSTKVMIENLLSHFDSPAFFSPGKRATVVKPTGIKRPAAVYGDKPQHHPPAPTQREIKRRPQAQTIHKVPASGDHVVHAEVQLSQARPDQGQPSQNQAAGPSRPTSPHVAQPNQVAPPAQSSSQISIDKVKEMLAEQEKAWESRLRDVEHVFQKRVEELEARLEDKIRQLAGSNLNAFAVGAEAAPQLTVSAGTPAVSNLGKRTERGTPIVPAKASGLPSSSPASKRARFTQVEGSDSEVTTHFQTPSPPHLSAPRTPSPSHQGVLIDQSKTPGVGSDFFVPPPRFSAAKRRGEMDDDDEDDEPVGLPFPIFATTPRPAEPRSPTVDAPPSASRSRIAAPRGLSLTPGRQRASPAPRSVSEAHKELTTITESEEPPVPTSIRRRVASADTPQLLTSALRGSKVRVSPSRLSPSPSIGAGEKEAFQYTPFPPVPGARIMSASSSRAPSEAHSEVADRTERDLTLTPPRLVTVDPKSPSPARAYMNVAMYGLVGHGESPSALATPGHRTMLGTERYRDTRFGDVPVVQWGTPSVDLGPGTPATSMTAKRDW